MKEPGRKFTNVRIFDLFAELHSFLVEMCSTRDYLARFISDYVLPNLKVHTMHKLWDKLRKTPIAHAVADSVLVACDEQRAEGWMARLGFLRNFVVHNAPIRTFGQFLTVNAVAVGNNRFLSIYLGIPRNPKQNSSDDRADALWYFYHLFIQMLEFARLVASFSPVPAEIPHIDIN